MNPVRLACVVGETKLCGLGARPGFDSHDAQGWSYFMLDFLFSISGLNLVLPMQILLLLFVSGWSTSVNFHFNLSVEPHGGNLPLPCLIAKL